MSVEQDHAGFCTHCSRLFESFEGLSQCPNCGTRGIPCSFENQVNVRINTHELRILCIWAENFANSIKDIPGDDANKTAPDTVYAIAARLRRQLGESVTLTMADELKAVNDAFPGSVTDHPAADQPENPPGFYRPNLGEVDDDGN